MRLLRAAVFLALAFPASAHAGDATIVSRELPVGGGRTAAAVQAPARFDLVGLHWQGRGRVLFRTRRIDGRWSRWHPAAPEAEDLPDDGSVEKLARSRWRLGNPYWTGPSDRLEYRLAGGVRRLRAFFVRSPVVGVPPRTLSLANSPEIVGRAGWNADERIRRHAPVYAPAVHFAIVHHTAGSNSYAPQASPAIVRAIELYHVKGNGWNDIGYNFLIDRYGRVFEGRYGGVDRNVVGAHAEGFNRGSVGVALLGNYTSQAPSAAAVRALAKLLAWRLDVAHVDPLSPVEWISGGNPRFPSGLPVLLRAIVGHRDTGFTDCPGRVLYRQLAAIDAKVAATGLPKLYEPSVRGSLGGAIRFSGRLSAPQSWRVTVEDPNGAVAAVGAGNGRTIAWRWDSSRAARVRYRWTMEAGSAVRPASGTIAGIPPRTTSPPPPPPPPKPPPELLRSLTISPDTTSPNGDGVADSATISYVLGAAAYVTATITDGAGAIVATLFSEQRQSARKQSFAWTAEGLADGRYVLTVTAFSEDGRLAQAEAPVLVDRTLGGLTASPSPFAPNGDGVLDTIVFSFALASPAQVTVEVKRDGQTIATVFQGPLEAGPQTISWNGIVETGPLADGHYDVLVTAADTVAEVAQSVGFDVSASATG